MSKRRGQDTPGDLIRKVRRHLGWSQERIAYLRGCNANVWGRWERSAGPADVRTWLVGIVYVERGAEQAGAVHAWLFENC